MLILLSQNEQGINLQKHIFPSGSSSMKSTFPWMQRHYVNYYKGEKLYETNRRETALTHPRSWLCNMFIGTYKYCETIDLVWTDVRNIKWSKEKHGHSCNKRTTIWLSGVEVERGGEDLFWVVFFSHWNQVQIIDFGNWQDPIIFFQ